MPYYNAGDYYGRGDYYQAGGIFGFLGGLVKKAVGFIPGIGPAIQAGTAIHNALVKHVPLPAPATGVGLIPGVGQIPGAGALVNAGAAALGYETGPPIIAPPHGVVTMSPLGTPVHPAAIAMQMMRLGRLHPNKSTYVTRGGGTSHWPPQLIVHPKGTEQVKSRRMNVGNARALRRAIRRASGFAKLARRVLVTTKHFKHKRKRR